MFKSQHPVNLMCLTAFTLIEAYQLSTICVIYDAMGCSARILISLGLTGVFTVALTMYALISKRTFRSWAQVCPPLS